MIDLAVTIVKKDFCKNKEEEIYLYCYCLTTWIEGTTSTAFYGNMQREFNMYNCSKCDNWFHRFCLTKCNIPIPKRNAEFICKTCTIPESLPWRHDKFINTCTSDNFLTLLLLHCKQYEAFTKSFGDSDAENTLKAAIMLMLKGKVSDGKTLFLHLLQSSFNLTINGSKYDCFGGENDKCLCLFTHIWKLIVKQKCTSEYCPNQNKEITKYPSTFSFHTKLDNLQQLFPEPGDTVGYCGAEFQCQPPKDSIHAITDHLDLTGRRKKPFLNVVVYRRLSNLHFLARIHG